MPATEVTKAFGPGCFIVPIERRVPVTQISYDCGDQRLRGGGYFHQDGTSLPSKYLLLFGKSITRVAPIPTQSRGLTLKTEPVLNGTAII
jgi:hypothetical protein